MAADRPLTERGFVEVKMGRSKFPGKPSKIGNRKRVNLSSCALPEDNDSSKAAKNIYLGLSVFNETFGDNEMVAPGPFHGFSMAEVEEALAEARLQQNEAELEHKKQGIHVNFWKSFQNELFSVMSCSSYNNINIYQINKTQLSFDGGGSDLNEDTDTNFSESTEKHSPKASGVRNGVLRNSKGIKNYKLKNAFNTTLKEGNKYVKFHSPRLKLTKLPCNPASRKSLQSQAAKKLLEKAKMSNILESNKSNSAEKKFILPNYSIHSSRVIKPNKKFFEESVNKRKFLRNRTINGASHSKKPRVIKFPEELKQSSDKKQIEEQKSELACEESQTKMSKTENSLSESRISDCVRSNSQISSTGKVILREARLQLDNSNSSPLEGPFSSPSASSLSPNSQMKINSIQSTTGPGNVMCGVCGVVRFYRFVDLAKKFGIYCCESCLKFISKIIKTYSVEKNFKLQCVKGKGLCGIIPIVKSQHLNIGTCLRNSRCQACWLKLCLKNFKMPTKLKQKLLKLLPINMQLGVTLELNPVISNDINNRFKMGNNIKDFKWLKENYNNAGQSKFTCSNKQSNWPTMLNSTAVNEKSLRKRNRAESENLSKFLTLNGKLRTETDEKNRQSITLKGPRVKHVCRSASVVLGQPLATFPSENSPTKKLTDESAEDCKNCDNLVTTSNVTETQGAVEKSVKETSSTDIKQEKKLNVSKQVSNVKVTNVAQQNTGTKSKKKTNVKTENPVSMDFWECYDPDEVCETGFGLIGSEPFSVRALCFLCGSSGQEKLIHCASCCEPYHEFCVNEGQLKLEDGLWKYDWVCPRCTVCFTCGRTSGQQLKCIKCDNSYHTECVDRVGGRLLYSPDRPWVCSVCLRCKSCNGVDVSIFVGNLPLCKACFILRQKGNYCPLCQRCYEDDDYDSKMMECGQCKCWVHAKCEGLSDEKYQVLSFLPESVEYVCRMCCVMPPAPWWIAVEAELKSGYLGILKALSKNRKACAMLKWSPRKQCTCRQVNSVSRTLDFDAKSAKAVNDSSESENFSAFSREDNKFIPQDNLNVEVKDEKYQPTGVLERKTSIEVISHPTESLKLTLKIMKGSETDEKDKSESSVIIEEATQIKQLSKEGTVRVKKCLSNEENSEDSLINTFDCPEETQISLHSLFKGGDFGVPPSELPDKRLLSSPLNPPSDSGIGSTDDELKASCLTDEESCKLDDQQPNVNRVLETKSNCDSSVSFLEEKRECFCFLEVDSYNSRSKPFSPNLMSIKKKVTTLEYTSLHQFHQDMQGMIATTQSVELMDLYHQTIKEIFPWFDPKYSRVQSHSQKISGTMSLESTPVKSTPTKSALLEECKVPREKLANQCLEYFYSDYAVEDSRVCLMCKTIGDGPPGDTGRLLYCGQNEWVHCNCALWSGEVFEEIDGSLQNVHSAISRGRSIRCPECNLKGASIGCCARNCQETYHFRCARQVGCIFMDDKTVYCPAHVKESAGKLVQNEIEFEIRRPVYVELDKRKMKTVDSSQIRFAVGALHVNNLGKFVFKLSDQSEAIIPEQFDCTRLYWSCFEPWRIVRYHFSVRVLDVQDEEGVDCGVNLTIDHSKEPELVELKLKQLKYFQDHNTLLDISDKEIGETVKEKCKFPDVRTTEEILKNKLDDGIKIIPVKRPKKDHKVVKKVFDHFDSKDDENCLTDNQNTAGLLPPDLEEAIFRDLPNDILDGISMQDIFMDIKNDSYDSGAKESIFEDPDSEDISESLSNKSRKQEYHSEASQLDFWVDSNECRQETTEEAFSKTTRDFKRIKYETLSNQQIKKNTTLRTYQKSCGYNWNCKTEGPNSKWKKNPKCHVTVNLLDSQERGNMLQELKFTDGLVTVSTGVIDSVKDLKARLEDTKCSIQQEEGKENKCLPWHTRLQPRLLQVDGGVDSSSSGSEAGESPQRLIDENINSKIVPLPQSSPFLDSLDYSVNSPVHLRPNSFVPTSENFSPGYSNEKHSQSSRVSINNLPQLDGVTDFYSDGSDSEELLVKSSFLHKRPRKENAPSNNFNTTKITFKINQCDGGIDSESDDNDSLKCPSSFDLLVPLKSKQTKDEPVKCKQCHCTYRTKISYQRHLESCCTNFILSSSEGEMSEEESPKKQSSNDCFAVRTKSENSSLLVPKLEKKIEEVNIKKEETNPSCVVNQTSSNVSSVAFSPDDVEKLEVKKEKVNKRTYTRKKSTQNLKKAPVANGAPQMQQILVPQPSAPHTLIVQDIPNPNIVPAAFTDAGSTVGYMATIDSQNPFGKPQLIATPGGIISGSFQYPSAPETQIVGGLCLNPQTMQANIPGIIIQQPHPPGPVISQPGPVLMSNEQMMFGPTGLFDVVRDPGTGGMYLTSHNQPVFYNMETIVSNTVMQTNQFVSNVLATSFSQTSTQIFQARELEQVVNFPSNYIVLAPSTPAADKIIPSDAFICIQTPQTLFPNQTSIQIPTQPVFNTSFQLPQPISAEPKIISAQLNPIRCLQPLQAKQLRPSIVVNKVSNTSGQLSNQPMPQAFRAPETNSGPVFQKTDVKVKPVISSAVNGSNMVKNASVMRPNVSKASPKSCEKATVTPKPKSQQVQSRSRALVDYINNFRSDTCDAFPLKECHRNQKTENCIQSCVKPKTPKPVNSSAAAFVTSARPPEHLVQSDISEVSPEFLGNTSSSKSYSNSDKTPIRSPSKVSTKPVVADSVPVLPKIDDVQCKDSVDIFKASDSLHLESGKDKSPEMCLLSNKSESGVFDSKKNEKVGAANPNAATKVLTNISNSFLIDREQNSSLSLPCLEDFPQSCPGDQQKFKPEMSPDSGKQSGELLPLQDNSQTLNTTCKTSPKSPQKISPVTNKTPPSDEKGKLKKKAAAIDQNSLDSTFFSENVNELKRKESPKRLSNGGLLFHKRSEEKGPKLIFDVISDDGFKCSSTSMVELWANICDSVQEMRAVLKIPPLPVSRKGHEILGMQNHGLQHCLEQLKGVEQCVKYKCKYFVRDAQKGEEDESLAERENLSGCARTEKFTTRKEYDMFAWLASKHRKLPKLTESAEETLSSISLKYFNAAQVAIVSARHASNVCEGSSVFISRQYEKVLIASVSFADIPSVAESIAMLRQSIGKRANSLPMAMRYRNLRETAKLYVGVYRSKIHGRGLFCLREIEAGEMVIEYAGEVIRSNLTDKREKYYTEKGIGCYMFRIDDHFVVDATMKGNAARFINHSCEPNCYSRVVDILGKKHIVIFALRRINVMEELTYDYKFPFEDEKISCHCLSKKCRKYLN